MYEEEKEVVTNLTHTTEDHTKFSQFEDEFVAEEQEVWFS